MLIIKGESCYKIYFFLCFPLFAGQNISISPEEWQPWAAELVQLQK